MSQTPLITLTNGVFDDRLSVLDRGLAYGDGLFETCRVTAGKVPLWERHRARLENGARHFGIPLDVAHLERERDTVLASGAGSGEGVLKLIVTRGIGGRAYAPPEVPEPSYCWQWRQEVSSQWATGQQGVTLFECQHRLGDNPALAGHKHLNRLEYVRARSEWRDEYPEGLLCDIRDQVIEGTLSNIFLRTANGWLTPKLDHNGVAGVMRGLILDILAPKLALAVAQCDIPRADLSKAHELFVCNSVFGIWPVIGLSSGQHFEVGDETRRLQASLNDYLREKEAR